MREEDILLARAMVQESIDSPGKNFMSIFGERFS